MPQTVAVIGASQDRERFSNKAVRAWRKQGWTVIPVHPRYDEVEGLKAYPRIDDVPGHVDVATLYLPPQVAVGVIDAIAKKGIKKVYVNPGVESPELLERARALGLEALPECSIVAIGENPSDY